MALSRQEERFPLYMKCIQAGRKPEALSLAQVPQKANKLAHIGSRVMSEGDFHQTEGQLTTKCILNLNQVSHHVYRIRTLEK